MKAIFRKISDTKEDKFFIEDSEYGINNGGFCKYAEDKDTHFEDRFEVLSHVHGIDAKSEKQHNFMLYTFKHEIYRPIFAILSGHEKMPRSARKKDISVEDFYKIVKTEILNFKSPQDIFDFDMRKVSV